MHVTHIKNTIKKQVKRCLKPFYSRTGNTTCNTLSFLQEKTKRKPSIIYLGNGAQTQDYTAYFKEMDITGYETHNFSGSYQCSAVMYPKKKHTTLVNRFKNPGMYFAGFELRKKENNTWLWFCDDHQWKPLSSKMNKRIFQEGEDFSFLLKNSTSLLCFQALWKKENTKTYYNCGHAIFSKPLMAHAMGACDDSFYWNTEKAMMHSANQGFSVFEGDFTLTSDKHLVLGHDLRNATNREFVEEKGVRHLTYEEYMHLEFPHGHKALDAKRLYEIMKAHPEFYVEIDINHFTGKQMRTRIYELVTDFQWDSEVLDRLLIQVRSKAMYQSINQVYPFKHYQFIAGINLAQLDEFLDFCLDTGICSIALRHYYAKQAIIDKIHNAGLYILGYTLKKDSALALRLLENGIDTLCVDDLCPADLDQVHKPYARHPYSIFYHSGIKEGIVEGYSDEIKAGKLQGSIKTVPSGCLEFQNSTLYPNDGTAKLLPNRYQAKGKTFVGWKLRLRIDGTVYWFCNDHVYHRSGEIKNIEKLDYYIYEEEAVLPSFTVPPNAKLIVEAVWKD